MIGGFVIDKPEGITSHDVVARVRRVTGERRVGHAGTLDPFATGVLVVCVGRATRLVQFLVGLDKEYIATIKLGYATDTQDLTGKQITPLRSSNELSLEDVRRVLERFTGPQLQTPPMFSAKKVAGQKLYVAARAGREVKREPVRIEVYALELIEEETTLNANDDGTRDVGVKVRGSSGTYVRTLAHDIGEALGLGAHLTKLRRTGVGHFKVDSALTLDELERTPRDDLRRMLLSPFLTLQHLPVIRLDDQRIKQVVTGRAFSLSNDERAEVKGDVIPLRLCDEGGALVAVGYYDAPLQVVRPRVVLAAEVR
ncbi:MAG TPA: tRNA pseudouridine(55) synthase TruB [Blastocatellia bacterium]